MPKTFKENQLVFYKNGDVVEVGKIKLLKKSGAFVYYHSGSTAAFTDYELLYPIINEHCILKTNIGLDRKWEEVKEPINFIEVLDKVRIDSSKLITLKNSIYGFSYTRWSLNDILKNLGVEMTSANLAELLLTSEFYID